MKGAKMVLACYVVLTVTHLFCLTAYGALCWAHVLEARADARAVLVSAPLEGGK